MSGKQRSYTKIARTAIMHLFIREVFSRQPFPPSLFLEPTNRCNMKCIFCLVDKSKHIIQNMPMKLYKRIMEESITHGLRESITLSGNGEPLLHPEIVEMVRIAKKSAYQVYLVTNGLSLSRTLSNALILNGLDIISIGLDGACKKTYESLRIGSSFDKVVENIKVLVELKKRIKSKIQINIHSVATKENKKETPQIKKMWEGKVNKVDISDDYREKKELPARIACLALWRQMAINSKGGVHICAYEYDRNRILEQIKEKSIQEIWHGRSFNDARRCHLKNRFEKLALCQDCDRWQSKYFFNRE